MTEYKVVPVEPTPQMLMAGGDAVKGSGLYLAELAHVYRAMLAASPDTGATAVPKELLERWETALRQIAAGERIVTRESHGMTHSEVENDPTIDYPAIAISALAGRKVSKWIRVEDRLPTIDESAKDCWQRVPCMTLAVTGVVRPAVYARNGYAKTEKGRTPRWEEYGNFKLWFGHEIVAWQPFPEGDPL